MNKYYYDLHIHSCLSPCGDNDMTPNNIVGMGVLNGLNMMALTDHNTSKNCPAFFKAAKKNGIVPIAGMELTTAEDIHIVCLFPELEAAMAFDGFVESRRMLIPNRTDIFGEQYILDENDEIIGEEKYLLSNATNITVDEVYDIVRSHGGISYPAHVDREANGLIATLGTFPDYMQFNAVEFHDSENAEPYSKKYTAVEDKIKIISSDAHYLWNIKEKKEYFLLDDEPYSSANIRKRFFESMGANL